MLFYILYGLVSRGFELRWMLIFFGYLAQWIGKRLPGLQSCFLVSKAKSIRGTTSPFFSRLLSYVPDTSASLVISTSVAIS